MLTDLSTVPRTPDMSMDWKILSLKCITI